MSDAVTLGAPDSMEGTKFRETDKHIVGFGLIVGFVDNNKNAEYCKPHPFGQMF